MWTSAFFWNRKPALRKSTIYYGVFSGFLFALFGHDHQSISKFVEIVLRSLLIGIGFYFFTWIECKEKGDSFW